MLLLLLLPLACVWASPLSPFSLSSEGLFNKRASSTCSTSTAQSCHNTTAQSNSCCFESPGGLLLQTQFWDTNPSTGPSNSWTIHGLWPDNCDGTFDEFCDTSREYTGISTLLTNAGATSTLSFMQQFWKDINGNDETFWEHEWAAHGTCYSTLKPSCLPAGSPAKTEAVDFFETVVALFKTLPTFTFLSNQGITPTTSKTFTLSQLTSALKAETGFTPAIGCSGSSLNTISWYFNLKGSLIDGQFIPIDTPIASTCPSSGIQYVPKTGGSPTSPTSTTTTGGSGQTGSPGGTLPSRSTLSGLQGSSKVGGFLTAGTWSVQTPATYTLSGTTSSFTLSTSKGLCAVSGGSLTCGSGVSSASSFSAVISGSRMLVAFGGSTAFTSDSVPSGSAQETVFTGSSHAQDYNIVIDAA